MINYYTEFESVKDFDLVGFFVGWPDPPNRSTFKKLLRSSYKVVLAVSDNKVVGFITAISDGVISAYIPFIKVLPSFQGQGIGKDLITIMKRELKDLYMIDQICDEDLIPYYEKQGMERATGALIRNYDRQSGNAS